MTHREFFEELTKFDWYFEMSDDHRVWTKGVRKLDELKAEAAKDPVKQEMLSAWNHHMYSGSAFGFKADSQRAPKPQLEDFDLEEES